MTSLYRQGSCHTTLNLLLLLFILSPVLAWVHLIFWYWELVDNFVITSLDPNLSLLDRILGNFSAFANLLNLRMGAEIGENSLIYLLYKFDLRLRADYV